MDLDNAGLAAAKLTFDSVDLFALHSGVEIDRSLLPAMTVAAMRFSGTAGEAYLADTVLGDVADRIFECLEADAEGELRLLVAEISAGGNAPVDGPFSSLMGRGDLVLATALVHDAVKTSIDPDYSPMTDAVAFLADSVDGYRPSRHMSRSPGF